MCCFPEVLMIRILGTGERLFVATWFATSNGFSDSWLIGNGFANPRYK
jgi:hypothetical protein